MDPLVAGSLVSAGTGLVGNLLGNVGSARAQKSANKTAIQISRENNAFNAEQAELGRDWQEKMWNLQNEYNTPSAQRSRLEDAGFNPYMMLGGSGSTGTASSAGGSPTASSSGNPSIQAPRYNFDLSSVSQAINSYFANRKLVEETRGKSLENDLTSAFGSIEKQAGIASALNGQYYMLSPDYQATMYSNWKKFAENSMSASDLDVQNKILQNSYLNLNADALRISNKYLDTSMRSDIMLRASQMTLNIAQGRLTDRQAQHELARIIQTEVQTQGQRIDNRQALALSGAYITAMKEAYEQQRQEAMNASHIARNLRRSGYWDNLIKSKAFDSYIESSAFGKGLSVFDLLKRSLIGGIFSR